MKPNRLSFLIVLALGACTSAPPATPAPVPAERVESAQPATTPATRAEAADPAAAPDAPPPAWWLGDPGAASAGAGVERAYRELLAGKEPRRTVVVGVLDSGVDITHEDLDGSLWVNEDEVPGNGVDDDGNGYADDVHGWNFIGGPDGRNVAEDTYEVTRLYAECRELPAGGPRVVAGDVACAEIEALFQQRHADAKAMLEQVRGVGAALERATTILRRELGTDSLTVKAVRAVVPMRADVGQARQIWLQLDDLGITAGVIADETERLEGRLARGMNPDFDPRPIVGDDYDVLTDRLYGNADVTGPDASHGTGVAGIIAAERGNGLGEDGIAPARILVVRVVPDGDERDKDVANAIRYAVDNGADVINMSFGKGYSPEKEAVDAAVRYAEEHGVLLVHAAGNEGDDLATTPSFPTRVYEAGGEAGNWIEVGASGWDGTAGLAAPFTNYGSGQVDVFAPGVDIRTADEGNEYQVNSGTSFSAPVVSGLAALIMAYYPELSATDVRRIILESARPFGTTMVGLPGTEGERVPFGELSVTGGIVDARAALEMAAEAAADRGS